MFSATTQLLLAANKSAVVKKAVTTAVAQKAKKGTATAVKPITIANTDRFTSTPYKSGKTTSASIFKQPFLSSAAVDDLLADDATTMSGNGKKKNSSSIGNNSQKNGTTTSDGKRKRRPNPFALLNEAETQQFTRLVKKNMRTLAKEDAPKVLSEQLKSAVAANKAATGTTTGVVLSQRNSVLLNKKKIYQMFMDSVGGGKKQKDTKNASTAVGSSKSLAALSATGSAIAAGKGLKVKGSGTNNAADSTTATLDTLITKVILPKATKAYRSRRATKHSRFYTDAATRARGETYMVDKKRVAKKSTKPNKADDSLNPVNISGSFFTNYERRQYTRLKNATLLLRDPRKVQVARKRRGLYKMWDKVMQGLVTV